MRCACCGRRGRRLRTGRGPDGRLLFDWCADCLADVQIHALGLDVRSGDLSPKARRPRPEGQTAIEKVPRPRRGRSERDGRLLSLRLLGLLLVLWGLILELVGAGSWLGFGPPDDGFGPTRINRLQLFSAAGGVMAIVGAWVGLSSLEPGSRRRSVARAVEAVALGLGLCVLVVGIVFHVPARDPWIVGVVAVAALVAWSARRWSRPRRGDRARLTPPR